MSGLADVRDAHKDGERYLVVSAAGIARKLL